MSRSSSLELDLIGISKEKQPLDRRNSLKGIQNAISRIDPRVLKSIIGSRTGNAGLEGSSRDNASVSDTKQPIRSPVSSVLHHASTSRFNGAENLQATSPLTIFYNGTVTVYDVPHHTAEKIIKLTVEGHVGSAVSADSSAASSSGSEGQLIDELDGDLLMARKHSVRRFLQKRKDRYQV